VDPGRLCIPEQGTLRQLLGALAELREAEPALRLLQHAAPDPERSALLTAVVRAIRELETVEIPVPRETSKPWEASQSEPPGEGA
jgi:hypothetical protein